VTGHQHDPGDARRGAGAARFGHSGDSKPGALRFPRPRFERVDARHIRVDEVEIGHGPREQFRVGEPCEWVLGGGARHGDCALGQRFEPVALDVVRRNHRLPAADQDAQADVVAFGALRFFDGVIAYINRERYRAHGKCVGLISARAPRGGDKTLGEIGSSGLIEKR
jgi:hypothetical protein